jgi:hypothetical protein
MFLVERKVGKRESLSIEFSVRPDLNTPINEWWGSLCLWVDGNCVGNPNEIEMVSIGLDALVTAGQQTGSRVNPSLSSRTVTEALDCVMQAIYGEEEVEWLPDKEATRFEVLSTSAGPFFDNWEAILLEEGRMERFIYRRENQPVCEARWEIGTFRELAFRADAELKSLSAPSFPNTIQ